jgi:hypothetical protein
MAYNNPLQLLPFNKTKIQSKTLEFFKITFFFITLIMNEPQ